MLWRCWSSLAIKSVQRRFCMTLSRFALTVSWKLWPTRGERLGIWKILKPIRLVTLKIWHDNRTSLVPFAAWLEEHNEPAAPTSAMSKPEITVTKMSKDRRLQGLGLDMLGSWFLNVNVGYFSEMMFNVLLLVGRLLKHTFHTMYLQVARCAGLKLRSFVDGRCWLKLPQWDKWCAKLDLHCAKPTRLLWTYSIMPSWWFLMIFCFILKKWVDEMDNGIIHIGHWNCLLGKTVCADKPSPAAIMGL